jgi:hypothetical protein
MMFKKTQNRLKAIGVVVLVSGLIIFGPIVILSLVRYIFEFSFRLDCRADAGGSMPFPTTMCGTVLFALMVVYYIWFVVPVPLVIPGAAIFFISKHFIK